MGGRDRPNRRVRRDNCLEFIGRDQYDIRSYFLYSDGIPVGRLFTWPHYGACFYDPDGSMTTDLSSERGTIRRVLEKHSNFAGRSYRLF